MKRFHIPHSTFRIPHSARACALGLLLACGTPLLAQEGTTPAPQPKAPSASPALKMLQIKVGDTRETVISVLGRPQGEMKMGDSVTLLYASGQVTLSEGKVASVRTSSGEASVHPSRGESERSKPRNPGGGVTFGSEEEKESSQTPGTDREIQYQNPSFRISMTKPSGWSMLLLPDHSFPKLPLDARGILTFTDTKMRYGGQVEIFTETHFVILVVFETEGYGGISDAQQLLMDAEEEGRQALGDFKITSRPSTTQMAGESWSTAEGLTAFKTPTGETADMAIGLYCTLRDLGSSSVGYMIGVVRDKDDDDKSAVEEILRSIELF